MLYAHFFLQALTFFAVYAFSFFLMARAIFLLKSMDGNKSSDISFLQKCRAIMCDVINRKGLLLVPEVFLSLLLAQVFLVFSLKLGILGLSRHNLLDL